MSKATLSLGQDFARALDPVVFARDCGIDPDLVQARVLNSNSSRLLLNNSGSGGSPQSRRLSHCTRLYTTARRWL